MLALNQSLGLASIGSGLALASHLGLSDFQLVVISITIILVAWRTVIVTWGRPGEWFRRPNG
jgi:hypothetical protein